MRLLMAEGLNNGGPDFKRKPMEPYKLPFPKCRCQSRHIVRSPREGPKTVSSYPQDIVEMTGKIQEVDYKIATNPVG